MGTITIDCHHKETDERQNKRGVGGRERAKDYTLVDNHCLKRRKDRTSQNSHNQTCGTKLRIITHTIEGNTIDGGEHQRHTTTDTHQRIETQTVLEHNNP